MSLDGWGQRSSTGMRYHGQVIFHGNNYLLLSYHERSGQSVSGSVGGTGAFCVLFLL